jgi:ABC-type glutathione transport system ATPase component
MGRHKSWKLERDLDRCADHRGNDDGTRHAQCPAFLAIHRCRHHRDPRCAYRSGAHHRRQDRDRLTYGGHAFSSESRDTLGGLVAVNRVSLDVNAGEVVGLVGDNAAGKSTLIKCISGVYQADEGEISFQGIETIYQDLALAGNLGISANIFLGREVKTKYLAASCIP